MSEPFIAEIRMFAGNFAPRNWAFCDGQLLAISQNTALFSLLGTICGGDGRTTVGLPDLRGRVPMHPGSGPGLSTRQLGQREGAERVNLITTQIPSHTHTLRCRNAAGDSASPVNNVPATSAAATGNYSSAGANANMNSQSITSTGGSQSHTNVQPFLCVNFIIALQGLFPSRG